MADVLRDIAPKADEQRPRRSWLTLTLGVSLAAHAGLAAMLWVEQRPQPAAGAVVSVEIVSTAGAASPAAAYGSTGARAAPEAAKPEAAPAPASFPAPDAPRAAREPPRAARTPRETPLPPAPERAPPRDEIALRPPVHAASATSPSASAAAPKPAVPRKIEERRAADIAVRRPAQVPPLPAKTPRLAAAAPRGSEHAASARAQTASVPIVAADAAPSAGPENGTTPPRYGFGSAANPIPRYPETARESGWEGVVMLSVNVGAGGEALGVSIAKSSGHGLLDAAAVDAVRRWRFEPARRAGVPIPGTATVPIRFRLED